MGLNTIRNAVITTAYALSALGLALLALDWHLRPALAAQERVVATCSNADSIRVHSRHWDQTKRPAEPLRTIAAPTPEECQ